MAKFNQRPRGADVTSKPDTTTHQGGPGFTRNWHTELGLLALTNFVGEQTYYEGRQDRDDRFNALIRHGAVEGPEWVADMLSWLRGPGKLRTAPLTGAVQFAHAREQAGYTDGLAHDLVADVQRRADEPGEVIAYSNATFGRKNMPKAVRTGTAEAINRLWNQRSYLKYGQNRRAAVSFADALGAVRPTPDTEERRSLFGYIIAKRWDRHAPIPPELDILTKRAELTQMPVDERRDWLTRPGSSNGLRLRGMTWEALSGWLQGPMDATAWEAIIPSMGTMALIRNLANFDQAGISATAANRVAEEIAEDGIGLSGMLPFQLYTAFRKALSTRWAWPLEQALNHTLGNVPYLHGKTLILIDTSSSMRDQFSQLGTATRMDAAALFGLALAARCDNPDVVSFALNSADFPLNAGESVLYSMERFRRDGYFIGGGTNIASAARENFHGHDRVVLLTDEQEGIDGWWRDEGISDVLPESVPLHTFNLAGYKAGATPDRPGRYAHGAVSDAGFRMIPLLEAGHAGRWPWLERGLTRP